MAINGGCLCGRVRYRAETDPLFTALCHCSHCQKQSGSAFSIIVGVKAKALSVEGEVSAYDDTGGEGRAVSRRFCPNCGSALFSVGDGAPGVVFIKAGTLDDARHLKPQMELWAQSAQDWVKFAKPMKRYATQP